MDRRDYYYSGDEQNGYLEPEEYRKMRYSKDYQNHENYRQSYNQNDYPENREPESEKEPTAHPVLIFQVILCLLAAAAVFAVKSIGGDLYSTVKEYYDRYVNTSDVITDFFSENRLDTVRQDSAQDNSESVSKETERETRETADETEAGGTNE